MNDVAPRSSALRESASDTLGSCGYVYIAIYPTQR
ncbi:hypothetical protein JYC42_003789 [Salmonella enterica]|nr:hypothetical protein [Salmonella enterica]